MMLITSVVPETKALLLKIIPLFHPEGILMQQHAQFYGIVYLHLPQVELQLKRLQSAFSVLCYLLDEILQLKGNFVQP